MSNAIAKIDERKLAKIQREAAIEVTEADAIKAAGEAGLPINLVKSWYAKNRVGKFVASGVAGNILADSLITQEEGRKISKALVEIVEGTVKVSGNSETMDEEVSAGLDSRTKAADAWAKVNGLLVDRSMLDIKAVEVEGIVQTSDKRENIAPQKGMIMQFITDKPIQVNNGNNHSSSNMGSGKATSLIKQPACHVVTLQLVERNLLDD